MTHSTRTRAGIGLLGALIWAPLLAIRIGDPDAFWHVAVGRHLLEAGEFSADVFSFTSAGHVLYAEVAADVLAALAHRAGGMAGYELFHVVVAAGLGALVAALARGGLGVRTITACLAALGSAHALSAKPQLFTYALFALVLLLLDRIERAREPEERPRAVRALVAVPFAFLAWGYLHRGGTLGLAVFVIATVTFVADAAKRELRRPLALSLGASLAALAANPGGAFYFRSALDLGRRSSFQSSLADWAPPTLDAVLSAHAALVPLTVLSLLGGALRLRRRMRIDHASLVVALTAFLFARSIRFAPLFAIALVPFASEALEEFASSTRERLARLVRPALGTTLVVIVSLAAIVRHHQTVTTDAYEGFGVARVGVPTGMARFLASHPPPGRMWNSFNLGGYFVYALGPRTRVFIDGRNDTVYTDAFFRESLEAKRSPRVFARQVARWNIGFAAVAWNGPSDPNFAFLHGDPAYALVYFDDSGAVYVRRTPAAAGYIRRFEYRAIRLDTAYARASRRLDAGGDALFAREVARAVRAAPRSIATLFLAGLVDRARNDRQAYLRHVATYLEVANERGLDVPVP